MVVALKGCWHGGGLSCIIKGVNWDFWLTIMCYHLLLLFVAIGPRPVYCTPAPAPAPFESNGDGAVGDYNKSRSRVVVVGPPPSL